MFERSVVVAAVAVAAASPAAADEVADRVRAAVARHGASLVRVQATTHVSADRLPGLAEGSRRTSAVTCPGVVVGDDGLVVFPSLLLDPGGGAFALLGAPSAAEVLAVSVVGQDGRFREARWVGRAGELAFVRVNEVGRAGLAPVAFPEGGAAPGVGDQVLVLSLGDAALGGPVVADLARVSFRTDALLGTTPHVPHALGGLVVGLDGAPAGLLATLPRAPGAPDLLRPDALLLERAGYVLPSAVVRARVAQPPREETTAAQARAQAWLGIQHEVLTPELAAARSLDVDVGILVVKVHEGPARLAGLQAGDVLLRMDGEPLDLDPGESFDDLVEDYGVGARVAFVVYRAGQRRDVEVELTRGPVRPIGAERAEVPDAGVLLRALTFFDLDAAELPQGTPGALVVEVAPDGAASRAGLTPGDFVLAIDGEPLRGLADARERLSAAGTHALTVRRRREELTLRVRR